MSLKTVAVRSFAAAFVSAASLTAAGPAHADPVAPFPLAPNDCDWIIFNTDDVIQQDNGLQVHVSWAGMDGGGTGSYRGAQGYDWSGPVDGGIVKGTNNLDFTIAFHEQAGPYNQGPSPHAPTNHYTGTIDNETSAHGTTVNDSGVSNAWTMAGDFRCIARAPAS
ncbi:hypothetical protein CQY20_29020 [Mycolicibacterium agri]|nr:hypothetical protein [Mycolicibacterium agri]PEG33779.1 hypothetical protein CQY20_29020 [Mycolicibacterium agri]